jgi:hypothetical protein
MTEKWWEKTFQEVKSQSSKNPKKWWEKTFQEVKRSTCWMR